MATSGSTLTRDTIIGDIAEIVGVDRSEIDDETNVLDVGLDSVRLMSLIERWRANGSTRADLVRLAADPVVGAWVRELTGDTGASETSETTESEATR